MKQQHRNIIESDMYNVGSKPMTHNIHI